jgi:hypothetical protein
MGQASVAARIDLPQQAISPRSAQHRAGNAVGAEWFSRRGSNDDRSVCLYAALDARLFRGVGVQDDAFRPPLAAPVFMTIGARRCMQHL